VIGSVRLSGSAIIGPNGIRAEWAEILALAPFSAYLAFHDAPGRRRCGADSQTPLDEERYEVLLDQTAQSYGVPVLAFDDLGAHGAEHGMTIPELHGGDE